MKIALITKDLIPTQGGAERYALQLATNLVEMGHEIHVFCTACGCAATLGIQHHPVRLTQDSNLGLDTTTRQIIADCGVDVVYSLKLAYPVDAYRAGDGVHAHWLNLHHPNPVWRWISQHIPKKQRQLALERCIYTSVLNCRAIITNSQLVKGHIEFYYPEAAGRIRVIYNGVDPTIFHPKTPAESRGWLKKWGIPESPMRILFAANNWERKGLKTLLYGAASLLRSKEALLIVVGRGNVQQWQGLAKKLKIQAQIFFVGSSPDMAQWYSASHVFVLPTQYDPFANVCLEAMACACPVITTLENGASELIQSGTTGYVLEEVDDFQKLEEYLAILRDPKIRETMGNQALQTALQFTMKRNASETLKALQRIL